MKLIKKSILFYTILIVFAIIIQSCCETNIKIIGNGEMFISQLDNARQDTIRSEFKLSLYLELEYANNFNNSGIITSSYGTQCAENYINSIDGESFKLFCNKDFDFEEEVVEAGTNFLDGEKMLEVLYDDRGQIEIQFNQNFLNNSEFSEGTHEFRIEFETSDGEEFTNNVATYLNI